MPKSVSAKKRLRSSLKRFERNRNIRSKMKSSIKKTLDIIKTGDYEEAKNMYNNTSSIIDRASQRGAIHKNKASREKSKLAKRLSKLKKDKNK